VTHSQPNREHQDSADEVLFLKALILKGSPQAVRLQDDHTISLILKAAVNGLPGSCNERVRAVAERS
jgi:hypothetical protein